MSSAAVGAERRGFRAPGTGFMVVGALIGAVGAFLFQREGGRALGPEAFAPVSVLWTLFFILATVLLVPVEQYVTREVAAGRRALPNDLRPMWAMAAIGAVAGGLFVTVTLDDLFDGDPEYVFQIALMMYGYALLFFGKGVYAGTRKFRSIGWVLVIESLSRLAVGLLAIRLFATATSLGWAMVIGSFSVLALRWWRDDRGESRQAGAPAARFLAGYVGGTSSSQLLLGGAPIAVAALGGSPALISIIFITFTLFRAPMTLIFAIQGRILPYLVGLASEKAHARLARIAWGVVGIGAVAAVLAGLAGRLIGADIVAFLFGEEFAPATTVAMFAAAGVVAASTAQVASQILVAEARTSRLSVAWFSGLVIGIAALALTGGSPDERVSMAFAIGEVAALVLMGILAIKR